MATGSGSGAGGRRNPRPQSDRLSSGSKPPAKKAAPKTGSSAKPAQSSRLSKPRTGTGRTASTGAQRTTGARTAPERVSTRTGTGAQRAGAAGRTGTVGQRAGARTATSQRLNKKTRKRRPRWQRWLITGFSWGFVAALVLITVTFIGLTIAYQRLPDIEPDDFAEAQSSTFYYSNGVEIGRLGVANREIVSIDSLPEYVPRTLVAAEDRSFYTNPGIDMVGTARAMFSTIILGKKQGGSTITQQYVERYYVGETTTDIVGKIEEALHALKISRQEDKDQILENYMNTVYFGRGAYGIEAAAREYFGKGAAELSMSESAMLAGILPAPSAWDPRNNEAQARWRWSYVLDGMVELGWLLPADRIRMDFPSDSLIEYRNDNVFGGQQGYILQAAIAEIERQGDLTREEIETSGYQIILTIDPRMQAETVEAVQGMPEGASPRMRTGAVVLEVETGAIRAMYGGDDYLEIQRNAVTQDIAQAGSTFKPFALTAALEDGIALESVYNGNSGLRIDGFTRPVANFRGVSYGDINLIDATANSVNTVYAQLAQEVGPSAVMDAAIRSGVPEDTVGLEANPANVLGTASPHVIDMASAYATFAASGIAREPYLVERVIDADGTADYDHQVKEERVIRSDVCAEVVYAMQQVVQRGSGVYATRLGRPAAGKTGSANDNVGAWFVGFTPQHVGAVALYQVGEDGSAESITPFGGFREITGGTVPVRIWTDMMLGVHEGVPVAGFSGRTFIGEIVEPSPSPTPSPTSSSTVSPSPSSAPFPTPSPSITIVPSPIPTPSLFAPSPTWPSSASGAS